MFIKLACKRIVWLRTCLGICLTVLFTTFVSGCTTSTDVSASPFQIKVLVITTWQVEANPWLADKQLSLKPMFTVPGADPTHKQLYCSDKESYQGVCLVDIGRDKVNAAASMMAVLLDPRLSFKGGYFMMAGLARTPSDYPDKAVTIGSTAWADWVVDLDQNLHLLPGTVPPKYEYGYEPPTREFVDSLNIFRLNPKLVQHAYDVTVNAHLTLQNTDPKVDVAQERARYGQTDRQSSIANCDTVAGDNEWAGEHFSNKAQFIMDSLTNKAGKYCMYDREDTAVAGALTRFPELSGSQFDPSKGNFTLNCYLNLRASRAYDQPYQGQELQAFLDTEWHADTMATNNLHLVGLTMVKQLLSDGVCNP